MGVRLYDPATARFLSSDPVKGGNANAYVYPLNPINNFDLDGRSRTCGSGAGYGMACTSQMTGGGATKVVITKAKYKVVKKAVRWVTSRARTLKGFTIGGAVGGTIGCMADMATDTCGGPGIRTGAALGGSVGIEVGGVYGLHNGSRKWFPW